MHNLADLRREYTRASLELPEGVADPLHLLQTWLDDAIRAEALEPNAMTLSTVNEHGRPRARIVLLKGIHEGKLEFYTNYQSDKGLELEKNPACALTFFWPEIERQIRIEGVADRLSPEKSDAYFQSRPRGSQIGAWASPQSNAIANRRILEERFAQLEKKFGPDAPIPRPRQWGGFGVEPYVIEFWQGRANRLHDRICYTRKKDNSWTARRLAP
ncbi:MAG: pyridoxamine 5'-phosphate oxidase [Bacteroidota bacterium]|jgi:pyridoxamine 5'-phosphate oxidase|nr:MAG: pyridoxamine 5'-phosphate oxidase [Bacteroidota bacterium]